MPVVWVATTRIHETAIQSASQTLHLHNNALPHQAAKWPRRVQVTFMSSLSLHCAESFSSKHSGRGAATPWMQPKDHLPADRIRSTINRYTTAQDKLQMLNTTVPTANNATPPLHEFLRGHCHRPARYWAPHNTDMKPCICVENTEPHILWFVHYHEATRKCAHSVECAHSVT